MVTNISDAIKYVGVDDHELDLFEGQYIVPDGMAYNSYVIIDEKTAVMDTVDANFADEWVSNVKTALDGRDLDYIVVQHIEPDHAGSFKVAIDSFPNAKIVGNAKTFTMLGQFFDGLDIEDRKVVVTEGDTLSLGTHELTFILAAMIHWPEVMMTYEKSEKVFFSADAFGKFGALDYDDPEGWACEARRYYFGIVGKYGVPVQGLLKKAAALDIEKILPLHGPVLPMPGDELSYYIDTYNTWSSYEPETHGVFVAYASIHGNTAKAAEKLAEMLEARGEKVAISDICREDMAECVEDAFRYDRMVICSSSYDGGIFLPMHDFLNHLTVKTYQNRKVFIMENGSWAPSAARTAKGIIEGWKNVTLLDPVVTIKSTMKDSDIPNIEALADAIVEAGK
ncbi:MAG: FprA family A-type flavoprotein [Eubacterium sp.]|jgi:flavorubredoxin|nr:FprA family A-type flavoprotein [Eubacterium sp.]